MCVCECVFVCLSLTSNDPVKVLVANAAADELQRLSVGHFGDDSVEIAVLQNATRQRRARFGVEQLSVRKR